MPPFGKKKAKVKEYTKCHHHIVPVNPTVPPHSILLKNKEYLTLESTIIFSTKNDQSQRNPLSFTLKPSWSQ